MTKYIIGAAFIALFAFAENTPAEAQNSTVLQAGCGTLSIPAAQGTSGTFMDNTGNFCTNASGGGGGGGAVFGPNANGAAASHPPVIIGGTDGTATGAVQNAKVESNGSQDVQVTSSVLPTSAATSANQATEITSLATIATNSGSAIPAGTALIGKVGIDQTTPGTTNGVSPVAAATGGATPFTLTLANSTNATNVKNAAGTLYHLAVYGVTATPSWLSLYNNAGTPTCGTGIVYQVLIPSNSTSGAGAVEDFGNGMNFSTGIAYCVTTGIAGTGSVAANSGVVGGTFK